MAYATKLQPDSDVHAVRCVSGEWICRGCLLSRRQPDRVFTTLAEFAEHLVFHAKCGHKVPMRALYRLVDELKEEMMKGEEEE